MPAAIPAGDNQTRKVESHKPAVGSPSHSAGEALPLPLFKELLLEEQHAFYFQEMQEDLASMVLFRTHPGDSPILPLIEGHLLQGNKGVLRLLPGKSLLAFSEASRKRGVQGCESPPPQHRAMKSSCVQATSFPLLLEHKAGAGSLQR